MTALLEAIERLRKAELIDGKYTPYKGTGLLRVEDAIDILEKFEIALRNECECDEELKFLP